MEATAEITLDADEEIGLEGLLEVVRDAGVVHGVDEEGCRTLIKIAARSTPGACTKRIVARGDAPTTGEEGRVELTCEQEPEPAPDDDGNETIDFRDRGAFISVARDELLARVIHPGEGEPGRDVRGKPIPPIKGKPAKPPKGKNTKLVAKGTEVRAARAGQLRVAADKLDVVDLVVVSGDLDFHTGNIECGGAAQVTGDVLPDFTICAGEEVTVGGSVDAAIILSGDKVVVRQGIVRKSLVQAKGQVTAGFISGAYVDSEADVVITKECRESTVIAGGAVLIPGKGRVCGGQLIAGERIEVGIAGQPSGVRTVLTAGVEAFSELRRARLTADRSKDGASLKRLTKLVELVRPEQLDQLEQLRGRRLEHQQAADRELETLAARRQAPDACEICVRDRVYEGVQIRIGGALLDITEERPGGTFVLDSASGEVIDKTQEES
jgi:uncharacterized protein